MQYLGIGLITLLTILMWYFKIKDRTRMYKIMRAGTIITLAVFIVFTVFIPPEIKISGNMFQVTGMYGVKEPLNSIEKVEIADEIPKILTRTNGMSMFGLVYRGDFVVKEWGATKLFLQKNKGPYIVVKYRSKYLIVNNNNSEKTKNMYQLLINNFKKHTKP